MSRNKDLRTEVSEPNNTPQIFGEAFRSELEEIIKKAVREVVSQNGHAIELLSAEAAGKLWGVPTSWIRDMARRGELPHVKLGHYTRFRPDDLARFIQGHRKEPSPPLPRNPTLVKKSA